MSAIFSILRLYSILLSSVFLIFQVIDLYMTAKNVSLGVVFYKTWLSVKMTYDL
jgi:hypothetical protein